MGGRGSSGGAGGGAFKMPSFTGSPKQVSWAQSIVKEGLDTIDGNISLQKSLARQNSGYKNDAKQSISVWNSIKKAITTALSAGNGKNIPASKIIDSRNLFNGRGVVQAYNSEMMRIQIKKKNK